MGGWGTTAGASPRPLPGAGPWWAPKKSRNGLAPGLGLWHQVQKNKMHQPNQLLPVTSGEQANGGAAVVQIVVGC
jgi:hypothetical protein